MSAFTRISIEQAHDLLANDQPILVDIRDGATHQSACIPGSIHLSNDTAQRFVDDTARDAAIIVYCYHGNSSLNAAQFLAQQGFVNVMSMDGGFEAWHQTYPNG